MHANSLSGRRVLVTQADAFMGPALCEAFRAAGAEVVPDRSALLERGAGRAVIEAAGRIDVLVLNLAIPAPSTPVHQVSDGEWETTFAALVHP
ncbi:MAG: short-chain dehydrogenase, partial [Thauera aminoaromatica]